MCPSVNRQRGSRGGWLLLIGIIITLLAREWNYAIEGYALPKTLYYSGWFAGLFLPLAFVIIIVSQGGFSVSTSVRTIINRFLFLGFGIFLVIMLQWQLIPEARATYDLWMLVEFTALPLWGIAGFLYATRTDTSAALLGRFGICAALGSLYSFGMRIIQDDPSSIPYGASGWPMRLFFLFGFCWYLSRYYLVKRVSFRILVGLFACSLEVVFTLHKPIIWATLFSVVTLLLVFRKSLHIRHFAKNILKLMKPVAAVVLVLAVVDGVYKGVVISELNEFYSVRVMHESDTTRDSMFKRAAGGRAEIWEMALNELRVSPWIGLGSRGVEVETGRLISLHNGYLDLLFMGGICGFTLVFLGGWLWLKRLLRSLNLPLLLLMQSSCLAYVFGILVYNTGGTSRFFPGISYFVMLVCGITLRLAVDNRQKTTQATYSIRPLVRFSDDRRST